MPLPRSARFKQQMHLGVMPQRLEMADADHRLGDGLRGRRCCPRQRSHRTPKRSAITLGEDFQLHLAHELQVDLAQLVRSRRRDSCGSSSSSWRRLRSMTCASHPSGRHTRYPRTGSSTGGSAPASAPRPIPGRVWVSPVTAHTMPLSTRSAVRNFSPE